MMAMDRFEYKNQEEALLSYVQQIIKEKYSSLKETGIIFNCYINDNSFFYIDVILKKQTFGLKLIKWFQIEKIDLSLSISHKQILVVH